jgi:hypothetical protein
MISFFLGKRNKKRERKKKNDLKKENDF